MALSKDVWRIQEIHCKSIVMACKSMISVGKGEKFVNRR